MIEGLSNDITAYKRFRGQFSEALDHRFYTISWLDRKVCNGEFRFWSNDTSAIIVEIKRYPTGAKEVHGLVAAGDIDGIVSLIPLAENWGRSMGCIVGGISSHPAWGKIMKSKGYEPSQLVLRKEL